MGTCSSNKLEKITTKDFNMKIPHKTHLPQVYRFSETIYFDNDGITALQGLLLKKKIPVVVKRFKKNENHKLLFLTEVIAYSELNHPNLLHCSDYFQTKKYYFIIYPYFDGKPVYQYLRDNPEKRNLKTIKKIIHQVLKVLDYMHKKNFVHKQIDHSKIIFDGEKVIVTGLGNSREFDPKSFQKKPDEKFKKSYLPIEYQSPETIMQNFDQKSDIWSMGILTYVLITGSYPFEATEQYNIEYQIKETAFSKEVLKKMKIPRTVISFIVSCLDKKPELRLTASSLLQNQWFVNVKTENENVEFKIDFTKIVKQNQINKAFLEAYYKKIMSTEERDEMTKIFTEFDMNGNGTLSYQEFKLAIQKQKLNYDEDETQRIYNLIDTNRNGVIEYQEFMIGMMDIKKFTGEKEMNNLFNLLDFNNDQQISKEDMLNFVDQKYRKRMSTQFKRFANNGLEMNRDQFENMIEDMEKKERKKSKANQI